MEEKVAIVLLNYNDNADLEKAVELLEKQKCNNSFYIVDNDSRPRNKEWLEAFITNKGDYFIGDKKYYYENDVPTGKRYYLIYNDEDAGFSGGNNVGFRIARKMGVKYALLVSPDVRIDDPNYCSIMVEESSKFENVAVAGSNILDLDNRRQSPTRMPSYSEELFWMFQLGRSINRCVDIVETKVIEDMTLHGCCMLFNLEYLEQLDYLDEKVFMYCEEPILAARVHKINKDLLFVPRVTAVHAHQRAKKASGSLRMQTFIKSRLYYINRYSSYNRLQKQMLTVSYKLCGLLHLIKHKLETV
jgi:GT2 family glycosyltransferase